MSAPAPVAASRPYTADSTEGRVLLALRAGTCEGPALEERFGSDYDHVLKKLSAAGLVTSVKADRSRYWSLTPEGRAACPYRNPLLVTAAGPDGVTAADLRTTFLSRGGRFVAYVSAAGAPESPAPAPRSRCQVTLPAITRSDNPRALAAILASGAAESDPAPESASAVSPETGAYLTAPRITIDDSGALTLSQPGLGTFTLAPPVVARLGRFLGAFDAPGVPS